MAESAPGPGPVDGLRRRIRMGFPRTVRGTLLLLLLVVLLPLLGVAGGIYYSWFSTRRDAEFQANLEVARAVALTFDDYVRDIVHQELAMGQSLVLPLSAQQVEQVLSANAREYPSVRFLDWVDPLGMVVASTDPSVVGLDVSDRAYFMQIMQGEEWVVSDLIVGLVTGEATFTVVRGIRDEGGAVQGVVLAAIDPNRLGGVLTVPRAEQGSISIIDPQGRLVYRYPEVPLTWEQRDVGEANPGVRRALSGEEATGTFVSTVDGQRRIGGFTPVRSIGWAAAASRPESLAMAPVFQDLTRDIGLLLLVAAAGLLSALILSRRLTVPMGRLEQHAQAIGRGELGRQIRMEGLAEMQRLAEAFNRTASEIRVREEQREEYVHAISHDLRAPLTVIQGQAQLLERMLERAGLQGREQRSLAAILIGARRMETMIEDLVDTARLESGQLRLHRRSVDMPSFMVDLKERLAATEDAERIRVEAASGLPTVLADPDRLERILMNLFGNALKYSTPGTPITVTLAKRDGEVVASVADQGPGISREELPHLFERYRRGRRVRGYPDGLGLGLYITKGLVEAHGGRIWVESVEGEGTVFSFTLPA